MTRKADGARPTKAARRADGGVGAARLGRGGVRRPRPGLPRIGRIVTPARAGGLLGMLVAGFLFTLVSGPSAFALAATRVPDLRWTDEATVRETLALGQAQNVFRLDTGPLEAALEALPAVADADVHVELPEAAVVVAVREREPILAWQAGNTRYLADRDGVLFASVPLDAELPPGVAIVQDNRLDAPASYAVGDRLDPVDLDVATRLASLRPGDVGSAAPRLRVRITESDGFTVFIDRGWIAVFGYYSPATRPADMIPGQVRLLRSLLADRGEATVAKVTLAAETDGTYVPKSTPTH